MDGSKITATIAKYAPSAITGMIAGLGAYGIIKLGERIFHREDQEEETISPEPKAIHHKKKATKRSHKAKVKELSKAA